MRLPENLKEILRSLNKAKEAGEEEGRNLVEEEERREEREVVEVEEEEDLHSLPAGVWPKQVNECLCHFTRRLRVTLTQTISNFFNERDKNRKRKQTRVWVGIFGKLNTKKN